MHFGRKELILQPDKFTTDFKSRNIPNFARVAEVYKPAGVQITPYHGPQGDCETSWEEQEFSSAVLVPLYTHLLCQYCNIDRKFQSIEGDTHLIFHTIIESSIVQCTTHWHLYTRTYFFVAQTLPCLHQPPPSQDCDLHPALFCYSPTSTPILKGKKNVEFIYWHPSVALEFWLRCFLNKEILIECRTQC